jgi:hypothetical protein
MGRYLLLGVSALIVAFLLRPAPGLPELEPFTPRTLNATPVETPHGISTTSNGIVDFDTYLCWTVASEVPVHEWYQQALGRTELMEPLQRYIATISVAMRSYTLHKLLYKDAISSSEGDQVSNPDRWNALSTELQNFIRDAVQSTHGWVLVDPLVDPVELNYPAEASYARVIKEPSPNGRGPGPFQGSHFQYPEPVILAEEIGGRYAMGLSQLGLARLVFGYCTKGASQNDRLDLSRPIRPWALRTVEDYLAAFYPNYGLSKSGGQIELLDARHMSWFSRDITIVKPDTQVYWAGADILGLAVEAPSPDWVQVPYHEFWGTTPDNVVMFHETPDGLRCGLGPEVGFYVQPAETGSYVLAVRALSSGYRLRAYLYDGRACVAGTGVSPRADRLPATAQVNLTAGQRYILLVDVESWSPREAERREHKGPMPPFRVSIKKN